jgi:hypothetical protein
VQRVRQAQSEDCSPCRSHGDGSRFYSTLGYMETSTEDEKVQEINHNIKKKKSPGFKEDGKGVLWYK